MKNKEYLITQHPLKSLFIFFMPIALGNIFQQFYNLVDSSILGKYVSEQALAAAAACLSLTNVFLFIGNGFGIGAGVIVGRYFGAKDYKNMRTVVSTTYITALISSILLAVFGLTTGRIWLKILKTPADSIDFAAIYLKIYFFGLPFVIIYNVTAAMFNATGNSKTPLFFLIFSSLLNIGLDLLFVLKFSLGIRGVAWATLIAQTIACIFSTVLFFHQLKKFNSQKADAFSKKELGQIVKIALPSIFQQTTISIGLMLIQSTINGFGSQARFRKHNCGSLFTCLFYNRINILPANHLSLYWRQMFR